MWYRRWMRLWVLILAACVHAGTIPSVRGMGHVHRAIETSSPEAQRHFDAGLVLAYGFNFEEAAYEFAVARHADPACAMCWWGLAYIMGPNINDPGKQFPMALDLAQRAAALAKTPVEKALTAALVHRYSMAGPPQHHAYAEAMRGVAQQFPDDLDVLVLATEALMIDTPVGPNWSNGKPLSPNITAGKQLLEHALARDANHIGAIHYYIHLLDDGPYQELTLPYADRLGTLAPGAGHLIHMPSHVYLHVGRWADAEDANHHAIAADAEYLNTGIPKGEYAGFTHHPKDFLWYVLLWEGERAQAVALARELSSAMEDMDPSAPDWTQTYLPYTYVRFAMWDEALALPDPKGPASGVAIHFAKGLALAAKGKLDDAATEADLTRKAADLPPLVPPDPNDPHAARTLEFRKQIADSAAKTIEAAIAEARSDRTAAIALLRDAVAAEDKAPVLGEPPAWPLSARHRLGAVLLADGKPADAAAVYREDLAKHPHNGWALWGLATALDAQHDPGAKAAWQEFTTAWARADVKASLR
jgi:tetratricopeptide (TPR) repeat protein